MNDELNEIYESDIQDRCKSNKKLENAKYLKGLYSRDEKRREMVQRLVDSGKLTEGLDYHHAALIFQHGRTSDDYRKAHELAAKALELCDNTAKWLYAASEDRYLLSQGKPQKYGTQFQKINGEWSLVEEIDPTINDEERAKYNVPPIDQALEKFKEKYHIE